MVVPSPSAAAMAKERARVDPERIVVIPNAVDIARFSVVATERETFLGHRHAVDPATRIGFLGRLDPVKRVEDLIRAMHRLAAHGIAKYRLDIFGDGAERVRLEQLARDQLGGQINVEFHGVVDSPGEAIKQMDILVLPSDAEGFGLVLIEAMATGVPVIATDVAGIRDVVTHNKSGLLVPPRSPEQLADTIRRVSEDRALCRRLITAGLEEVRQKYSWDAVLPQYRRLLQIESPI
jgi:glycosyltransferase involved in cell wall biosynthesis